MAKPLMMSEQRAIAAAYVAGDDIEDIVKRFGRCSTTIDNVAKRLGLPRRRIRKLRRLMPGTVVDEGRARP